MSEPAPDPATLKERAEQLVREGFGWEDLQVKLQISRELAKWYVFKQIDQMKKK